MAKMKKVERTVELSDSTLASVEISDEVAKLITCDDSARLKFASLHFTMRDGDPDYLNVRVKGMLCAKRVQGNPRLELHFGIEHRRGCLWDYDMKDVKIQFENEPLFQVNRSAVVFGPADHQSKTTLESIWSTWGFLSDVDEWTTLDQARISDLASVHKMSVQKVQFVWLQARLLRRELESRGITQTNQLMSELKETGKPHAAAMVWVIATAIKERLTQHETVNRVLFLSE